MLMSHTRRHCKTEGRRYDKQVNKAMKEAYFKVCDKRNSSIHNVNVTKNVVYSVNF